MLEDDSTEPPFHTDADHREFVSAGAAAGLAVDIVHPLDCLTSATGLLLKSNAALYVRPLCMSAIAHGCMKLVSQFLRMLCDACRACQLCQT